jgi:hypothetical protein
MPNLAALLKRDFTKITADDTTKVLARMISYAPQQGARSEPLHHQPRRERLGIDSERHTLRCPWQAGSFTFAFGPTGQ